MQVILLTMLLVPTAPVPKDSQPERAATLKILIECAKDDSLLQASIQSMGRLNHPKAVPHVQEYLKHQDVWVRCRAIAALIELDAVDSSCVKVLREIEKDRLVLGSESPLRHAYGCIYFTALRHPGSAEGLAPFFVEKYDSGINEDFANGLFDAYRRFAHLVPGELDRKLKLLKTFDPAKGDNKVHEAVLHFAIAVRFAKKPPKGTVEELERWWSTEKSWVDLECAQTLLMLDPKNKVATDILDFHHRQFKPDNGNEAVRLGQMLQYARQLPELFAKLGKLAFTPGIGNTAAYMFADIGRQGKASQIFHDDLERWTHTKSLLAKYAAMEALIRIKPDLHEKYSPILIASLGSKSAGERETVLDSLISLGVNSPESIAALEKGLLEWEPLSRDSSKAARTLIQLDPGNKAASAWIEARLKSSHEDRKSIGSPGRYNQTPEMLTAVGPNARKYAPLLIELLKDGERPMPFSEVIDAIEAVTRPSPK